MIRTIAFFSWFGLTVFATLPFALVHLALSAAGLGKASGIPLQLLISRWARLTLRLGGMRVSYRGLGNVPARGNVCFISNHQGNLDNLAIVARLPRLTGFMAKIEALYIPVLNLWFLAMGCVFMHRGNIRKAKAEIERGADRLRRGHPMLIYPEGTRSRSGETGPFKPGAFKLALLSGADIVPVAVDGTWRAWEAGMRIHPEEVRVAFLKPVPTIGLDAEGRKGIPELVRNAIVEALAEGRIPDGE